VRPSDSEEHVKFRSIQADEYRKNNTRPKYCFGPHRLDLFALRYACNFNRATRPDALVAAGHVWFVKWRHHFSRFSACGPSLGATGLR
jgi:hypothetical protein